MTCRDVTQQVEFGLKRAVSRKRLTHDCQLVLAVEQDILTAAFHRVDEFKRESSTPDDGDVGEVTEPVSIGLQVSLVNARFS